MMQEEPKRSARQPKNGLNKNGDGRGMHPNSQKNLKSGSEGWQKGESGNPRGQSITARQNEKMSDDCPFPVQGKTVTWGEALAEGGMRMALTIPVALSNLQDRQEGKVTQPITGSFEILDTKELTDGDLAVIAATNILKNNTLRRSQRATEEAASS